MNNELTRAVRRLHRLVSRTGIAAAQVGHYTILITTLPADRVVSSLPKVFRVHLPKDWDKPAFPEIQEDDDVDPDFPPDYDDLLIEQDMPSDPGGHWRPGQDIEARLRFRQLLREIDRSRTHYGRKAE